MASGSLRTLATQDNQRILNDVMGFSWDVDIANPSGVSKSVQAFTNDVFFSVDPDTGESISSRKVDVTFHISDIVELGMPKAIASKTQKPWVISFRDPRNNLFTFYVIESQPDRILDMVGCTLERYTRI